MITFGNVLISPEVNGKCGLEDVSYRWFAFASLGFCSMAYVEAHLFVVYW